MSPEVSVVEQYLVDASKAQHSSNDDQDQEHGNHGNKDSKSIPELSPNEHAYSTSVKGSPNYRLILKLPYMLPLYANFSLLFYYVIVQIIFLIIP